MPTNLNKFYASIKLLKHFRKLHILEMLFNAYYNLF